jgi:hypothetical protein
MSEMVTLGTCGNCGGPVQVHKFWACTEREIPRCRNCGARPKNPYAAVIPMESPAQVKMVGLRHPYSPTDEFIAHMMESCPPEEITAFSAKEQKEVDEKLEELNGARL